MWTALFPFLFLAAPADTAALHDQVRTELHAHLQRAVNAQGIPGMVIVAADADGIFFAEGAGLADREVGLPVDVQTTQFRLASVSKVIAALAVMQQVEAGRLNLHAPVNAYLHEFRIQNPFPRQITLANLLTHTAGFDDQFFGMGTQDFGARIPLGKYLGERLPPVVWPPGTIMSYSNHGVALAGHVVECVTGTDFADYCAQHILAPLRMDQATFALPEQMPDHLAQGYTRWQGALQPTPYDFPHTVPASSLIATGIDLGRFLQMLLRGGELDGVRVLSEAGVENLFAQHFAHHPLQPGRGLGWAREWQNDYLVYEHDGLLLGFISSAIIVPALGMGFFAVANCDPAPAVGRVFSALSLRGQRPRPGVKLAPRVASSVWAEYRRTRYPGSDALRFGTLSPQMTADIVASEDVETGDLDLRWTHHEGRELFGSYDAEGREIFLGSDNEVVAFSPETPPRFLFRGNSAYHRLAWWEHRGIIIPAAACAAGLLQLPLVLLALSRLIVRWRRYRPSFPAVAAQLTLLVMGGCVVSTLTMTHPFAVGYGPSFALHLLGACGLLLAFLLPLHALGWYLARGGRSRGYALLNFLPLAAHAVVVALLVYWNLVGWSFGGGGAIPL